MGEGGTEGLPFWLKESSSTCNEQFAEISWDNEYAIGIWIEWDLLLLSYLNLSN